MCIACLHINRSRAVTVARRPTFKPVPPSMNVNASSTAAANSALQLPRNQQASSANKNRLDATVLGLVELTKMVEEFSEKAEKKIQVLYVENKALKTENKGLKKRCTDLEERLKRVEKMLGIVYENGDPEDGEEPEEEIEVVDIGTEDGGDSRSAASREALQSKEFRVRAGPWITIVYVLTNDGNAGSPKFSFQDTHGH